MTEEQDNFDFIDRKNKIEKVEEFLKKYYDFIFSEIVRETFYKMKQETNYKPFYDEDFGTIFIQLQKRDIIVSESTLDKLISSQYISKRVNEINEYFTNLKAVDSENEMKALSNTLTQIGPDTNETFYICFRRWLIACYACAMGYSPNQVCLVLVGAQGIYKSTWLDNLCPPALKKYGIRTRLDLNPANKDTFNLLAEKFLINIDDQLATLFHKDSETIKTYITAPNVSLRKAFARRTTTRPRLANFVASVNATNFLSDTENRRYLVSEVAMCDTNTKIDMDRVWAEVKFLYEVKKEQSYFNADEVYHQKCVNDHYVELTQEEEWLRQMYRIPESEHDKKILTYRNATELMKEVNHIANEKLNFNKLIRAIKRMGFVKKSVRKDGIPCKKYEMVKLSEYVEQSPF